MTEALDRPRDAVRLGVLALQGDFAAHAAAFFTSGAAASEVRRPGELAGLDALVLPGGESTTLLRLIERDTGWRPAIAKLVARGAALFATCAGLILIAREVRGPEQPSLGLLDVGVRRNAYGRQIDSFEHRGAWRHADTHGPLDMVFIRAPRIERVGSEVEVLARYQGEPVLVRQGAILAATFHPELTSSRELQRFFLEEVVGRRRRRLAPAS